MFGAKKVGIIYPLSEATTRILASYTNLGLLGGKNSFVDTLSRMILTFEKFWENPLRGVVIKCN